MRTAVRKRPTARKHHVLRKTGQGQDPARSPAAGDELSFLPIARDHEAPEGALSRKEAPEAWQSRDSEAPDAGDGRVHVSEDAFTHGRSKS